MVQASKLSRTSTSITLADVVCGDEAQSSSHMGRIVQAGEGWSIRPRERRAHAYQNGKAMHGLAMELLEPTEMATRRLDLA